MTPDGTGPAGETREDGEERLRRERAQAAYDREYAKAGRPWWQTDRGILAIAAAVLIVIAVIAGIGGDSGPVAEPAAPAQGDVASDVEAEPAAAPEPPPPTPEPVYYEPTKRDFRVDLKVLSKDCFGSAGCLIDVRPDLTFLGLGELDPGVTYELTFEVVGPLTDPVVKTLDITGEDYGFEEFTVDTTTDGDVDARVIGFEERRF